MNQSSSKSRKLRKLCKRKRKVSEDDELEVTSDEKSVDASSSEDDDDDDDDAVSALQAPFSLLRLRYCSSFLERKPLGLTNVNGQTYWYT
jgi:hypothetical protein